MNHIFTATGGLSQAGFQVEAWRGAWYREDLSSYLQDPEPASSTVHTGSNLGADSDTLQGRPRA